MESVKYSFTITLKPNLFQYKAEEQYDKSYLTLVKHLMTLSKKFSVVAELTKNYNIHYHGIITFTLHEKQKSNFMKKFTDSFRKNTCFGFVNIKQITDEQGWINYITKDLKITRESICRPPVLIDSFNIIPTLELDGMLQQDLSDDC